MTCWSEQHAKVLSMNTASYRSTTDSDLVEAGLVREHLPLVGYLVTDLTRRLPRHVSRDDLTSAGMAALALAARGFEPERGVPFNRYASTRIRGALLDELRSVDWASRSVRAKARQQEQAADVLAVRLLRPATRQELATELGVSTADIDANQRDVHRAVVLSFQAMLDADAGEQTVPTTEPSPDQVLLARERTAYLLDAVATLPERLRGVVVAVFFEERSMQEIAAELGVTESRISQLRTEALALLRDGMNSQLSPEALAPEERPDGRIAKRKMAYYAAIASRSDFHTRLSLPLPREATRSDIAI